MYEFYVDARHPPRRLQRRGAGGRPRGEHARAGGDRRALPALPRAVPRRACAREPGRLDVRELDGARDALLGGPAARRTLPFNDQAEPFAILSVAADGGLHDVLARAPGLERASPTASFTLGNVHRDGLPRRAGDPRSSSAMHGDVERRRRRVPGGVRVLRVVRRRRAGEQALRERLHALARRRSTARSRERSCSTSCSSTLERGRGPAATSAPPRRRRPGRWPTHDLGGRRRRSPGRPGEAVAAPPRGVGPRRPRRAALRRRARDGRPPAAVRPRRPAATEKLALLDGRARPPSPRIEVFTSPLAAPAVLGARSRRLPSAAGTRRRRPPRRASRTKCARSSGSRACRCPRHALAADRARPRRGPGCGRTARARAAVAPPPRRARAPPVRGPAGRVAQPG